MSDDGPTKTKAEMASEKSAPSNYDSRTSRDDEIGVKVEQNGHVSEDSEDVQHNWGRLVVDPEEAKIEFGEERAAKLKKTPDGKWILWPQPTDDPEDPLNWSRWRKNKMLAIYCFGAFVPDFTSSLGIGTIFPLAQQFNTTTTEINDLTSNWSIFLLAWGGIAAVMLISRFGRLPVLFWSQFAGTAFMIGCTVAPTLSVFAGMRCLQAFFSTTPQITGLYAIKDMFFFHEEARRLNVWTYAFILSPYVGPFIGGFMVSANISWRWVYAIGCIYQGLVTIAIFLFGEETLYDRKLSPVPKTNAIGVRKKLETLTGVTGIKLRKYRMSTFQAIMQPFLVFVRPNMIMMSVYIALTFAWAIGLNTTLVVFVQSPPPMGYGFSGDALSGIYCTPLVSTAIGMLSYHFLNDFFTNRYIRRHNGVFEPEARLACCYIGSLLMFAGQILAGGTLQHHLSVAGLVFGWGMYVVGIMISVSAIYNYGSDCYPFRQGEVSALLNGWRTMLGFAVAFWEVPFATRKGPLLEFGAQSAIIAGATLLIPLMQWRGKWFRHLMKPLV